MRKYMVLLVLALSSPAWTQQTELLCEECRDVRAYPTDFGNHAFNEAFLPAPDGDGPYSTQVAVQNSAGQRALVYIYRILISSGLTLSIQPFISYQLPYPSPYVQISVQDAWGTLTGYTVLADSEPLLVGDEEASPPAVQSEPTSEALTTNRIPGGEELIGGYDGVYNYYGSGSTFFYYNYELMNE